METEFCCEFCGKKISSLKNLKRHQKETKFCLDKQKKIIEDENKNISCDYCFQEYASINFLNKHLKICEKKKYQDFYKEINYLKMRNYDLENSIKILENNIIEKDKEISRLLGKNEVYETNNECLLRIAEQPKHINNNITNNLAVYDTNLITKRFENKLVDIKPEDLYDGQKSIARLLGPCLLNDDGTKMIHCTDFSRDVFITKDEHGKIIKDIKCKKLACAIEPIATEKAEELIFIDKQKREKLQHLNKLRSENKKLDELIHETEDHVLGYKENTESYQKYSIKLNNYKKRQIENMKMINEYISEGIDDENVDESTFFDEKLYNSKMNIEELKTNSTKLSNELKTILV